MFGEHHSNLATEFPEFKERIHSLKANNTHFAKLAKEFEDIDKEIYRIEEQIEVRSDSYTEDRKKQRLVLKDQIYKIIKDS